MAGDTWRIIVNSLGDGGAGLIYVLKKISPLSESRIAALLFRAPSELVANLSFETATGACDLLRSVGLDCRVVDADYQLIPGDADHEVALVVRSFQQMAQVIEQVTTLLGIDLDTARSILCASPTVLIGGISHNTVRDLRRRFEPLGVEVDVSRPDEAHFDLFLGECSSMVVQQVLRLLKELRLPVLDGDGETMRILAADLTRDQASQIWERTQRTTYPLRIVNRDFQRFDLRLDAAPDSDPMIRYLVASTGMPEKIARKVPQKTPIVLQQSLRFAQITDHLAQIAALGGRASGHLLSIPTILAEA